MVRIPLNCPLGRDAGGHSNWKQQTTGTQSGKTIARLESAQYWLAMWQAGHLIENLVCAPTTAKFFKNCPASSGRPRQSRLGSTSCGYAINDESR